MLIGIKQNFTITITKKELLTLQKINYNNLTDLHIENIEAVCVCNNCGGRWRRGEAASVLRPRCRMFV